MNLMVVSLKGMKFYAFHGFYDFERRVGDYFELDVDVHLRFEGDPKEKIENTLDYEEIYKVSERYMQKNYLLLESLAYDIASDLKRNYDKVEVVEVRLSKLNPHVGGEAERASVTIRI